MRCTPDTAVKFPDISQFSFTSGHPAFNDLVVHARKYAETLSTEVRETSESNICLMTMHHRPPAMPAFVSAENPNYHSDQ